MITENLQLIKLDAKYLQVKIHNVLTLVTVHNTLSVQIQIQLPN